jgi:hypothetical protein
MPLMIVIEALDDGGKGMGHEDLFRQRWLHANCLFRLADPRREARHPARGDDSGHSAGGYRR